MSLLFSPLSLRDRTFRNRLWVSPMCMYSAVEGVPQNWHRTHLAQFASGGAVLVVDEATAFVPEGRISPRDPGLWMRRRISTLVVVGGCSRQRAGR